MNRLTIQAAVMVAVALCVLIFIGRAPRVTISANPTPTSSSPQTQPKGISANIPAARLVQSVAGPAVIAGKTVNPSKPLALFHDFAHWVQLFTNSSASLMDGERLAWQRREAMLDLIQNDPKKALELAV
ncbi:MAG: hypothetical protein WCS94_09310, partial [Verrucomicrobiota bacterium]